MSTTIVAEDAEPAWVSGIRKQAQAKKRPHDFTNIPPVETRFAQPGYNYGKERFSSAGATVVWDAFNKEALFICGANGGDAFGAIGSWTVKDGKEWKKMEVASSVLPPYRKAILAARMLARDAENSARNIYYSSKSESEKKEALKSTVALMKDAIEKSEVTLRALTETKIKTWEAEAIKHATPLLTTGIAELRSALDIFLAGQVDSVALGLAFDGQWKLDEVAGCIQSLPVEKYYAFGEYDPVHKSVLLFGGSHGDYVSNETWLYDCQKKLWKQIWPRNAPEPRAAWTGDSGVRGHKMGVTNAAVLKWDVAKKMFSMTGGLTVMDKIVQQTGYKRIDDQTEWSFNFAKQNWVGEGTSFAAGSRVYRSVCPNHNPKWFDTEKQGTVEAADKWHRALKPNVWTRVPLPERKESMQDWGTSLIDIERDQLYHWTGGHEADPSTMISTYHIGVNRWSIGYIPEVLNKGMSFNGRPDCENHTYSTYTFDPLSKKIISLSYGGTAVYDPDKGDYEYSVNTGFHSHSYVSPVMGTPKGVYSWKPGVMRLFNETERKWEKIKTTGKIPHPVTDGNGILYDSKRECIWLFKKIGYGKPFDDLWRFDINKNTVTKMNITNISTVAAKMRFMREAVYLPKLDLILFNNVIEKDGVKKHIAYDPNTNAMVLLDITFPKGALPHDISGVSNALLYDSKRELIWAPTRYQKMWVLKIDPKTIKIDRFEETASGDEINK
ncbi:MAG: hypothetical protein KAI74_03060 [Kiritimatiellae bacterium]|nr:hypothetical protein [Kiritimatiellia bacterium]